ncbi:MAG: YbaN family protein [Armatimonadetes bacterium]|nr:YbaN family protein [Armatimonadota bacterium]
MPHTNRPLLVRSLFAGFGIVCVGVGFVGIITPGLPGFVFFLIALWAFRNSSERLESWLLANRTVGPTLRDWEEHRSMRLRTKVIAISMIWVAIGFTIYRILSKPPIVIEQLEMELPKWIPVGLLAGTILALTVYLARGPTKREA